MSDFKHNLEDLVTVSWRMLRTNIICELSIGVWYDGSSHRGVECSVEEFVSGLGEITK